MCLAFGAASSWMSSARSAKDFPLRKRCFKSVLMRKSEEAKYQVHFPAASFKILLVVDLKQRKIAPFLGLTFLSHVADF